MRHHFTERPSRPTSPQRRCSWLFLVLVLATGSLAAQHSGFSPSEPVYARVRQDRTLQRPVLIHAVVALCDNENQGIVPVPKTLGNGRDPASNLYWGAAFGLRTFFQHRSGWKRAGPGPSAPHVIESVVLEKTFARGSLGVSATLIAEAWDGQYLREAIEHFLLLAAGQDPAPISSANPAAAAGPAHLVVFVGHNGLLDFSVGPGPQRRKTAPPMSSIVLACASKPTFGPLLERGGSHPLLLTTNLMAPEAYTLDAAIAAFVKGESPASVRDAAARAYSTYQRISVSAARGLFWSAP